VLEVVSGRIFRVSRCYWPSRTWLLGLKRKIATFSVSTKTNLKW
jgi:hypothetical protein